jgi:hypothetical protein
MDVESAHCFNTSDTQALRAEQLSRRKESDYLDEEDFEDDGEDDLEKPTGGFGNDKLTGDLEFIASGGVRVSCAL